jgi:tRNA pseudouridine38-40 synthase
VTRWALLLEYDGAGFVGWQRQAQGISIQAVLEDAAGHLSRGAPVAAVAAGRTDAGVHAEGQVVHLDLEPPYLPGRLRDALNFHLQPHAVSVVTAAPVPATFSARFDALARCYRYRILNRPARPALLAGRVWHVAHPLDAPAMHAAAQALIGRHDFTSFRAAACQAKSPLRTLDRLDVRRCGDMVVLEADARSFLHHQVRNMMGTLKLVGEARWPGSRVAEALAARDRSAAGPTAPPQGLCLTAVHYATDLFAPRCPRIDE